jgi:hypothetical protein
MRSALRESSRPLFGGSFVFGVTFSILVLAVVTATVAGQAGRRLLTSDVVVTLAAAIFFAAVVGLILLDRVFRKYRSSRVRLSGGFHADQRSGVYVLLSDSFSLYLLAFPENRVAIPSRPRRPTRTTAGRPRASAEAATGGSRTDTGL